ncbi:MAG: outer membrane protein transport protein [Thermodesulfovibrionales bacterium]|jgi:long-chain fatty acid transport protein
MKKGLLSSWGKVLLITLILVLVSAGSVFAAGFALIEQSMSGLGNAYSGGAASAEDASTIFYNPAGMTLLNGRQLILGTHIIMPSVKFHNEGSTLVTGQALSGGNGGDGGVTKPVPNLYYSRKVSDKFFVGMGINAPFGLATDYNKTWVGRYHAVESDVMTVNINPSVAYKINDQISVGAGLDVQYLKATLSNAVDFGTAGYSLHIPGLLPQSNDGFAEMEGDSWGIGYNFGLLYELNKNTRAGIAYRSRIKQNLEGDIDFSHVPAPFQSVYRDGGVKADLTLPDNLSISLYHNINTQWAVMADFTWTNWSLFKKLAVEFDNPGQKDSVTTEKWQDNYRYSLGVTYTPCCNWILRAGTAYDTTAVESAKYRTPRIPDGDRIWAALGAGYRLSDMVSFDIGYAHLFINDPEINKKATGEDQLKGALKGSFDVAIDIVSAQVTLRF